MIRAIALGAVALGAACQSAPGWRDSPVEPDSVLVARLGGGEERSLAAIGRRLEERHPGYRLRWFDELALRAGDHPILVLLEGSGWAGVRRASRGTQVFSEVGPGDRVLLRPGEELFAQAAITALAIRSPHPLPPSLPTFLRATDGRPPALSWLPAAGPGTAAHAYQGLNVERVHVRDTPTHVHPREGGFDVLLWVRSTAAPTSLVDLGDAAWLARTDDALRGELAQRARSVALEPGSLVYVPRGVVHRIIGDAEVDVVAIPGFLPGGERTVDAELRALNERFGLSGATALPVYDPAPGAPQQP